MKKTEADKTKLLENETVTTLNNDELKNVKGGNTEVVSDDNVLYIGMNPSSKSMA